jgi:hypothetical protein
MKFLYSILFSLVFTFSALADKVNEPAAITVASTSTTVLAPNTQRMDAYIRNTGSVDCDIARGRTAVLGRGYHLKAGEIYIIDSTNLYAGALSAITSAGTTTLQLTERSK